MNTFLKYINIWILNQNWRKWLEYLVLFYDKDIKITGIEKNKAKSQAQSSMDRTVLTAAV